ncbi:helix-turn-helix domain-containing protein [Sediminitomix flava]|uniref:Helix-turn-helix domain-containing protein n=1 Tax=Sediminitomix flava TaxID=379075 RepID=A0A315ZAE4_SEDFL|nr:helix-turn-helix domain-containing protein [Sediminitomix flava]PWJ42252.1 hypothetical protein BC781_103504 [Sediminitomix flava]
MNNNAQNQLFSFNTEAFKAEIKAMVKEAIIEVNSEMLNTTKSSNNENGFLDSKQASKFLNISTGSLHALQAQGFIKPYKLNRKKLYKEAELVEAMEKKRLADSNEKIKTETKAEAFLRSMKARQKSHKA